MTAYDSLIIADGAQGYWKLNEPSGSTTYADSTANGKTLTLVNPGLVDQWQIPGIPVQGALSAIDGKAGLVANAQYGTSTSGSFQFTIGQSFSFEIWIGGVGAAASALGVFTRGYATAAQDSKPWYLMEFLTDGTVQWWLRNAAGIDYICVSFSKVFDATYVQRGPWHHLVGVFDHVALQSRLYIDGLLQSQIAAPNTGWGTNAGPFALGAFNGVVSGLWMCCAAFYIKALSQAEITSHYETGRDGVAWYPYQQTTDYSVIIADLAEILAAVKRSY